MNQNAPKNQKPQGEHNSVRPGDSLLQSFYDSAPMMMGVAEVFDNDILHLSDNAAAARFLGYLPGATAGRMASELGIATAQIQEWIGHYRAAERAKTPVRFEYPRAVESGQRWMAATVTLLGLSEEGRPRCSYILEDITTQKQQAQEALQQSEQQLRLALDSAHMGSWQLNLASDILDASETCKANFGFSPDTDFTYAMLFETIHPDDRAHVRAGVRHALETNTDYCTEYRIFWPDGSLHWVSAHGRLLYTENGTSARMIGTTQNIPERKRAETLLSADAASYRRLADAMPQIIWTAQPDGYLDYYNERWYEFTGFERGLKGDQSWEPILHPDDLQRCYDSWYNAIRAGKQYEIEYRFKDRATGGYRWFLGRAVPAKDAQGNVVKWFGSCTDIDEQKQTGLALNESRERLRAALMASGTGTFRWDIRTNELEWDESLDRLFGLPPGKTARSLPNFLAMVHPEERAGVVERCERCATEGADFEMEFRVVWPDGSIHWLYDRGKTFIEEGKPSYMAGACVDITERVQHLQEIETLNARLRRSIQETHHRVKNNLQIISALAELQTEDDKDTVPVTAMKRIGQHTRSLAAIHDLLTQKSKTDAHVDSISIQGTLDKLIPLLQAAAGGAALLIGRTSFVFPCVRARPSRCSFRNLSAMPSNMDVTLLNWR